MKLEIEENGGHRIPFKKIQFTQNTITIAMQSPIDGDKSGEGPETHLTFDNIYIYTKWMSSVLKHQTPS